MRITGIELRRLRLPLVVPYRLSYRTFHEFEPFLVTVHDETGRTGFAEGHISPGSSVETRDGGWAHLQALASQVQGRAAGDAFEHAQARAAASPVATSALLGAIEMLQDHPLLRIRETVRLPILTPTAELEPAAIQQEVEQRLGEGFRTFKVKVGKDVDGDLQRVRHYQVALAGRGRLRLDANRAFDRAEGCRFAAGLDAQDIELFEQPCASEDWDGNAAVAAVCTVPLMLDEPICKVADVERAAGIPGVEFCKVKLKRFGTLTRLDEVLQRIRALGLTPVLGDGLASEPGCWMEACVARARLDNAGEFNGFLKPRARLFEQPLVFDAGDVVLSPGPPRLDRQTLAAHTVERVRVGEA